MPIHPTAIVDPSAQIAADAEIGPYAVIGPDTRISARCRVGAHAIIEHTALGEDCQVFPHACLGLAPQHTRYAGEKTRLEAGKKNVFREGVSVHRGTPFDAGVTSIGDNGFFMGFSHIAHDCRIGNNVVLANGVLLAGHVSVGDNVFISGLVAVHQFVRIGRGAMVSGGAMAVQDVAPFCIAQGDRAVLRGLNLVGMRRAGASRTSLRLIKEAYRVVFLSGARLEEALQDPALLADDPLVAEFRSFLSTPKRGFARPPAGGENREEEEALA